MTNDLQAASGAFVTMKRMVFGRAYALNAKNGGPAHG